jgi:hypothetical protein
VIPSERNEHWVGAGFPLSRATLSDFLEEWDACQSESHAQDCRCPTLEDRLGAKPCERTCLKCTLAQLPIVSMPDKVRSVPEWAGCDARPVWSSLSELLHAIGAHGRFAAAVTAVCRTQPATDSQC